MTIFFKLLALTIITFSSSLEIGDDCTVQGRAGVCALDRECEAYKTRNASELRTAVRCGFQGINTIICCPSIQQSTPTQPPILKNPPPASIKDNRRVSEKACEKMGQWSDIRITLGEDALPGEFPQFAALGYLDSLMSEPEFSCGGVLISKKFVLTAAHCVSDDDPVKIVRLGTIALKPGVNNFSYRNKLDVNATVGFQI